MSSNTPKVYIRVPRQLVDQLPYLLRDFKNLTIAVAMPPHKRGMQYFQLRMGEPKHKAIKLKGGSGTSIQMVSELELAWIHKDNVSKDEDTLIFNHKTIGNIIPSLQLIGLNLTDLREYEMPF